MCLCIVKMLYFSTLSEPFHKYLSKMHHNWTILYILILATSVLFIVFIADGSPESRLNVKFVQDTTKFWYKPEISRDQGEKTFVFTDLDSNWSDACPFFFSLCVWPKWVGFSLSFCCCHEQYEIHVFCRSMAKVLHMYSIYNIQSIILESYKADYTYSIYSPICLFKIKILEYIRWKIKQDVT